MVSRLSTMKEALLYESGTVLLPSRCIFYLTSMCNLNCKMCFQKVHKRKPRELSFGEIQRFFHNVALSSILLVGGEIFTRPDIYDIIDFFNSSVDNVSIQTNATLLDQDGIEILKKMDHVRDIWISIDGLYDVNDIIRGSSTFEHAINVIKALNDSKRIFINSVILKDNIHQLQQIYDFFNDMRVYQLTFQFEMGYSAVQYLQTSDDIQRVKLEATIDDNFLKSNPDFSYAQALVDIIPALMLQQKSTKLSFYPNIFLDKIHHYIKGDIRDKYKVVCSDLLEPVLKIDSEGNIVLCEAFGLSIGNLRDVVLEDVWNCNQAKKNRKLLSEMNLLDLCSRCCCLSVSRTKGDME